MSESRDVMIKRLQMRSMRRGIKEMDLILSDFATRALAGMDVAGLTHYDALLEENDHDIYGWVSGQFPPPAHYLALVTQIAAGAKGVANPP